MVGVLKRSTTNFNLGVPNFNVPGWGEVFEKNMNIIDAVLSTAGVVSNIVGEWDNNTVYGVDDRVVDSTDNSVWQCAVGHTSGSGTFADDRSANPTYWDEVSPSVVVRGAFVHGTDYFVGDFVYDESEFLAGIVISNFTGDTNLRNNINDLGVISDIKDLMGQFPDPGSANAYLKRNAGNTAYESKTAAEVLTDILGVDAAASSYLKRNAGDTAFENKTPTEVLTDIGGVGGSTGATDNRLVRSDGTGGKTVQSTGITVDDSNNVAGIASMSAVSAGFSGAITVGARSTFAVNGDSAQIKLERTGTSAGLSYIGADSDSLLDVRDSGATTRFNIDQSGHIATFGGQIKFPATQSASADANTFDDYEEGTYTPTIAGGTTAGSATYGIRAGWYIKNGGLVTASFDVSFSGHTGSGQMQANPPITAIATGLSAHAAALYAHSFTFSANSFLMAQFVPVSNFVIFADNANGSVTSRAVPSAGTLRCSFAYQAS